MDHPGHWFHGTNVTLSPGEVLEVGYPSNYCAGKQAGWVYLTGRLDIAVLAAELALGEPAPRVYVVEPLGSFEDDPNVTDKRFPGNPTRSFRSREGLRVVGEVLGWQPTPPERLAAMRATVERMRAAGIEALD